LDRPRILIVEDDEAIRSQLKWALCDEYDVFLAGNRAEALERVGRESPPLVLLDLGLPPSPRTADEGIRCLRDILRIDASVKVIVVTGNQERENALKAIEQGAFDYFLKPAEMEELKVVLKRALHLAGLEREGAFLNEVTSRREFVEIIGESPRMKRIFTIIRKVAATDAPVLIEGESGTGKELIAKAIHRAGDGARKGPFVAINCGAIPENLLESELFGHEKGSFTGADAQRKGKIEYAAGGTLFLDEIGELPLMLQVKILRFLQEYEIERIGGREAIRVNVRVIAATNRDLEKEVRGGRFREDLYYRLGVVAIKVPPLRERDDDVAALADYFLKKASAQYGRPIAGFTADALSALRSYSWPGNVRELENRIRRAVIMSEKRLLAPEDLNLSGSPDASPPDTLRDVRSQVERDHIRRILARNSWNISRAASELDVSRPTLHDLIRKYRIRRPEDVP
jgi:two-component system, NtrC family, response regulator